MRVWLAAFALVVTIVACHESSPGPIISPSPAATVAPQAKPSRKPPTASPGPTRAPTPRATQAPTLPPIALVTPTPAPPLPTPAPSPTQVVIVTPGPTLTPLDTPPAGNGQNDCNAGTGSAPFTPSPQCSATPAAATLAVVTPIYTTAGAGSIGGGYVSFDKTAAQDLFVGIETDATLSTAHATMNTNCPAGGNCFWTVYYDPGQLSCTTASVTANYAALFASPGPSDRAFTHNVQPTPTGAPSPGNRTFDMTSPGPPKCDSSGGNTGNRAYYPNLASIETYSWLVKNLMTAGGRAGYPDGDGWNGMRWDNLIPHPIDAGREWGNQSMSGSTIAVGFGVDTWRTQIGQFETGIGSAAKTVMNSEGGVANYATNNGGTFTCSSTSCTVGVVDWRIRDEPLCDALSTTAQQYLKAMYFEKVIASNTTVNSVASNYVYPFNLKIAVNTASVHFNDTNCANIPLGISGMTGKNGSASAAGNSSWLARSYGVALRALMEPTTYTGAAGCGNCIWMLNRFSADVQGTSRQEVYPEDGLVFGTPDQALSTWCWGGNTGCNGNSQCGSIGSNCSSDANGNGCYSSSGDTGGVNNFVQKCGSMGVDPAGGTAPVYLRTFTPCAFWGVRYQWCGVAVNMSTGTDTTLGGLTWGSHGTPSFELIASGCPAACSTELYDDPITPGHHICTSATICTGTTATSQIVSVTGSTALTHCAVYFSNGSKQAVWDAQNTANNCVAIVLGPAS